MSIVPNRRFRETQEMTEPPYSKNVMWLRKVEEDRFLLMVYNMDTAAWVPITCVWDDILCKPWWTEQIHKIFEYDEHGDVVYDSDGAPKLKDNVEMLADNIKFVYNGSSETIRGWKEDDPKQYPDVTQTRTVWRLDGSDRYVEDTIQKFTLMPDAWNILFDYYMSGQYDMNEVIAAQIANEIGADDVMFAHWLNLLDENDKSCLVRSVENNTYELITMNSNDGFVVWNTVRQDSVTDTKPVFSLDYIMEKLMYLIEQCECIKSHMDDDINNNNNNEEDMSEYATKAEVQAIQNQLTQLLSEVQTLSSNLNTQRNKIYSLENDDDILKKYYLATKDSDSNFNDISSSFQNLLIKRTLNGVSTRPFTAYLTQMDNDETTYYFDKEELPQFYDNSYYNAYVASGNDETKINEYFTASACAVTDSTVTSVVDVTNEDWTNLMSLRNHVIGEYDSNNGFSPNVDDIGITGIDFSDGHGGYDKTKKYIAKNGNNYALVTINEASADLNALDDLYSGYIVYVQLLERKTVGKKDALVIIDKDGNSHFIG